MWIRPMLLSDVEQIRKLESDIFKSPWSENSLKDSVESQLDYAFVMENDYKIAAYIIFRVNCTEAELFRIATDKCGRKTGCGHKLMEFMFARLREMNVKKVFLEVRSQNVNAVRLYKQYGFKNTGIRKGYYSDPTDDAILMEGKLC